MRVDQQSMKMGDMTWFTKQDSSDSSGDVEIDKRHWYNTMDVHVYTVYTNSLEDVGPTALNTREVKCPRLRLPGPLGALWC